MTVTVYGIIHMLNSKAGKKFCTGFCNKANYSTHSFRLLSFSVFRSVLNVEIFLVNWPHLFVKRGGLPRHDV